MTSARFEEFDYNGIADEPVPALKLTIQAADLEVVQYYSMGKLQDWIPSEDGKQLLSVGSAINIRLTSNGGIFLKSLVDAGFPADKLGDDISILDGLQAHMIQVPEPERGLKKTKEQEAKEKKYGPKTILVVSEVQVLPWEKKKPGGKLKRKAAKKTTKTQKTETEAEVDTDIQAKAGEVVTAILADAGTVTRTELPAKIFKHMKGDTDKNKIIKLAFDPEETFLKNGPWAYTDGTLIAE